MKLYNQIFPFSEHHNHHNNHASKPSSRVSTSSSFNKNEGTVFGKQVDQVRAPSGTKLIDIEAPNLSLNLGSNQLSRSITLSTSQNVANARIDQSESNFKNKDRSAVVRAVVSVSDSDGNLVRKGTVTDITNEQNDESMAAIMLV